MRGLVSEAMESDNYLTLSVSGSRASDGDSALNNARPCTSGSIHASVNGFTNGLHAGEDGNIPPIVNRVPLRSTLSSEENDDQDPSADDGVRNNMETGTCPKYRSCRDRLTGDNIFDREAPSCSTASFRSAGVIEDDKQSCETRRSRKRTADCQTERSNLEADASLSDTSNDDYSLGSEDGCIYTYRGGEHLADLPSSFFSLDMGLPRDRHLPAPQYVQRPAEAPREERHGSRASSPDMDYLEMDFDPGPSGEADSGEETSPEEDLGTSPSPEPQERAVPVGGTTPDACLAPSLQSAQQDTAKLADQAVVQPAERRNIMPSTDTQAHSSACGPTETCQPSTSTAGLLDYTCGPTQPVNVTLCEPLAGTACMRVGTLVPHVNVRGERVLVRRTCQRWPPRAPVTHHTSSGDLICERGGSEGASGSSLCEIAPAVDRINLSSALYHCTMAKKLIIEKPNAEFMEEADTSNLTVCDNDLAETDKGGRDVCISEVSRCMIWSEREACEQQVTQIGTSACGATSVVNAFLALGIPIDINKINNAVGTQQRANNAPIPRYLLSRAVAGCTAAGLVAGLQQASDGLVTARFFPTFPERVLSLSHWLADWISLGAVPIVTLNLQAGREFELASETPDAWHHQMVFGVSPRGLYLTNPVECVPECQLWPQLCSDSALLVRSNDVLARLTPATDLTPLMAVPDPRWATYNVLGQVVNVLREARECDGVACGGAAGVEGGARGLRARHVRVPCAYRAGVTISALTGSEAHRRLMRAQHLPLYTPLSDA